MLRLCWSTRLVLGLALKDMCYASFNGISYVMTFNSTFGQLTMRVWHGSNCCVLGKLAQTWLSTLQGLMLPTTGARMSLNRRLNSSLRKDYGLKLLFMLIVNSLHHSVIVRLLLLVSEVFCNGPDWLRAVAGVRSLQGLPGAPETLVIVHTPLVLVRVRHLWFWDNCVLVNSSAIVVILVSLISEFAISAVGLGISLATVVPV